MLDDVLSDVKSLFAPHDAPTASVDPTARYQTLEVWGTSLAWWAHVVGGWSDARRNALADLVFSATTGLGLTVVRYNIGGGDHPSHHHMRPGGDIPGYAPAPGHWDWGADANQRWMLAAARARGATLCEAFSNSPPYCVARRRCIAPRRAKTALVWRTCPSRTRSWRPPPGPNRLRPT